MSLHRVVRPHTTSHAASRVRPRGKCGFLRAALCNTRVETRAEFARVKRARNNATKFHESCRYLGRYINAATQSSIQFLHFDALLFPFLELREPT